MSGGLNGLYLKSSKEHEVADWGKQYGFTYKKEQEPGEGQVTVYHRLLDNSNQLVLQAIADARRRELRDIALFSSLFKTHGGIGVGSTLGEMLYAHEYVVALSGEDCVLVSIPEYNWASFVIDHVAGAPDSDVDIETLDENLKISRVDFRLD
jgi:hypothetical protein